MKQYIHGMDMLASSSCALGNKVKNIAFLSQHGVRVPRGFGITYEFYTKFAASLLPALRTAREQATNYTDMAKKMHEIVISAPVDNENILLDALGKHIPGATYFAVRSSGAPVINGCEAAEDSSELSLAGQYESYLQVPAGSLVDAVKLCYASLFSERCLRQFNVMEDDSYLQSRMSVLVQEMFTAQQSAVVMTRDPVEGGDAFGLEITYGACESLVCGSVQGDLYILSRATGAVKDAQLGTKTTMIAYEPFEDMKADNKKITPVPTEKRQRFAATTNQVTEIYNMGMSIEKLFDSPQDIELVVSGGEIIVVQTRPITAGCMLCN